MVEKFDLIIFIIGILTVIAIGKVKGKKVGLTIMLSVSFGLATYLGFQKLSEPVDNVSDILGNRISNAYTIENAEKGSLLDCNGIPLIQTIDNKRLIIVPNEVEEQNLSDEYVKCFSNTITANSNGVDKYFSDLLYKVSPENEDTKENEVYTTLDSELTWDIWQKLDDIDRVSLVVYDNNDGSVLSMISKPTYNYNDYILGNYYTSDGKYIDFNGYDTAEAYIGMSESSVDDSCYLTEEQVATMSNSGDYKQYAEVYINSTNNTIESTENPDGDSNLYKRYVRLSYGKDNYDSLFWTQNGFDPNLSMSNTCTLNAMPGSSFKTLVSAVAFELTDTTIEHDYVYNFDMISARANSNGTILLTDASSSTRRDAVDIQTALKGSSNQFFYFLAQNLSNLDGYTDSYYKLKTSLSSEEITESGKILVERLNRYFCINGLVNTNFGISDASVGTYFENWQYTDDTSILDQLTDTDTIYTIDGKNYVKIEDSMWQEVKNVGTLDNPKYESVQTYFSSANVQAKKLGEVGHGIGTAQISPLYLSMVMGKCITGTMYTPTLLKDETSEELTEERIIGEPFTKDTTVDNLRECLNGVYTYNQGSDTLPSGYTAFEKTGTSSQSKTNFYGDFGNTYYELNELDSGTSKGYQTVWYSGAIEDGERSYSIVVKAFATSNSSHSLHEYFMKAIDSLQKFDYLN